MPAILPPSAARRLSLAVAALLLGACQHHSDSDPAPAPAPVPLQGTWTLQSSYYKYTDDKGNPTNTGGGPRTGAAATQLDISAQTFQFTAGSNVSQYFYTRTTDSTAYTFYMYNNLPVTEKNYSILELKDHRLVTRYVWTLVGGGRFTEKEIYIR